MSITRRDKDGMLRHTQSDGEHGLENGAVGVVTETAHLACAAHVHTEDRVSLLQSAEREL